MRRQAWITLIAAAAVLFLPLSWAWLAFDVGGARLAPLGGHNGIACEATLEGEPPLPCAVQITPLLATTLLLAGVGAASAFLATRHPTRRAHFTAGAVCALALALILVEAAMGGSGVSATLSRSRVVSHTAVLGIASATLFVQGSRAP